MVRELNGRQRLELALLEDDADVAATSPDQAAFVGAMAAIVRYAFAEGITREHFTGHRESSSLNRCFLAVGFAQYPDDFAPGCLGHDILTAAGFFGPGRASVAPAA